MKAMIANKGGRRNVETEKRVIRSEDTRVENWRGYYIRFVEIDGEWWAILKDICDALGLKTFHVAERLDPNMLEKVRVDVKCERPRIYKKSDSVLNDTSNSDILSNDKPPCLLYLLSTL